MIVFSRVWRSLSILVVIGLFLGGVNYAFFQNSDHSIIDRHIEFPFSSTPSLALISVTTGCLYDLQLDTSFQKYLSDETPFADRSYIPNDLLAINSDFTANNSTKFQLREEAGILFANMARQFWHDFNGDKLTITSAYRSPSLQNYLFHGFCKKDQCAKPGTSEHQAGLAIDLAVKTKNGGSKKIEQGNIYYDWFVHNAHLYGFHNTYQKGVDIDGKIVESRHRRYLGTGLATILHENKQSFAEWMNSGSNQLGCPSLTDLKYK